MFAQVLNADQIQRVHVASLQILERLGVEIPHAGMQAAFCEAGARIDREKQRVFIPAALVARCLSQAGLEAGVTLAFGAAAGADIFGHMGISGVDQATSLDMLVLQDEVIGYVESTLRPLDFSDEALGLETIRDVEAGANFIDHAHTLERFRKELWFPKVLDRSFYEAWRTAGAASTEERCRQRKEELLTSHQPEPVSAELNRELDRIVAAARKELAS